MLTKILRLKPLNLSIIRSTISFCESILITSQIYCPPLDEHFENKNSHLFLYTSSTGHEENFSRMIYTNDCTSFATNLGLGYMLFSVMNTYGGRRLTIQLDLKKKGIGISS